MSRMNLSGKADRMSVATSPKVMITGDIGTGKTVLTQRFGTDIARTAKALKQNLQYIHINCREFRGSLFMILKQVLLKFTPQFPQRGFSSEELLHILLDQLETKNLHIEVQISLRIGGDRSHVMKAGDFFLHRHYIVSI